MNTKLPPINGAKIPVKISETQIHGTVKTDTYWTGDNKGNNLTTVATPSVNVGPASVSVAVGKDRGIDTPPSKERDVGDVFVSAPITPNISAETRIRTSHGKNDTTTQVRGGIQVSAQVTDNARVYAQVYGASKKTHGGASRPSCGVFAGVSQRVTNNTSVYVEAQAYDLNDIERGTVGINAGMRISF